MQGAQESAGEPRRVQVSPEECRESRRVKEAQESSGEPRRVQVRPEESR